jgi:hypothetical protein
MKRAAALVLVPFLAGGCTHYTRAQAKDAAAAAAIFALASLFAGAVDKAARECGGNARVSSDEMDDRGRRAKLKQRVRCAGFDRSYKQLCVTDSDCYYERNDGRIVRCAEGDCSEPPSALVDWCNDKQSAPFRR